MRLLLLGDAASTGFGRVGRELARRFVDAGVDLRWIAINWRGRDGELLAYMRQPRTSADIAAFVDAFDADPLRLTMIPAHFGGDMMGNGLLPKAIEGALFANWKPDRLLIVADPRAMSERLRVSEINSLPTYNYVPIEGRHLPPAWRTLWSHVVPVAMSECGRTELETLLGRDVVSIPHGISDAFYPINAARPATVNGKRINTKADAKASINAEGRIVILRTDRFVPRKNYPALLRSMGPVLDRHPEALLVIHCAPVDEGGVMAEFISQIPGSFEVDTRWRHPQIRFTGGHDTFNGYSDEALNVLYNAADIYASPTKAEGFGLTLAEAAATGCPVVTTDYAAGPEAVGAGGVLVPPSGFMTNEYAYDWALVDEDRFASEVEALITDPVRRAQIGRAGIAHVKRLSWDSAATQFLNLME